MIPRHDRTGTLRSEAPEKNDRRARPIVLLLSLLLLSVGALLASCGGGPTVATPTGRTLYLATTSGIYGFSIMSDGTLQALSSSPLATGSYNQIAATTGSSPLLIGANGGTSLTTWNISGEGLGSQGTLSVSNCISSATGVAVTSDNNYVVAVDGGVPGTSTNIASLPVTGGTCHTASTSASSYPVQPALDCSLPASQNCILFLTVSSSQTITSSSLMSPVEYTYTEGSGVSTTISPSPTCTAPDCPLGAAFNPNTLYFYATFNGSSPSLQSFASQTATAAQSTSFPTPNLTFPCIDALGGVAYIPTSNGYVYAVPTGNGGGLGSPSTVLTPQSFGSTLNINSCAVGGS